MGHFSPASAHTAIAGVHQARITCTLPHLPHQSPSLRQFNGMLEVFAQCERAMMPMRLVAALDVQPQREETRGGKIPYGYCLAADGGVLAE